MASFQVEFLQCGVCEFKKKCQCADDLSKDWNNCVQRFRHKVEGNVLNKRPESTCFSVDAGKPLMFIVETCSTCGTVSRICIVECFV